MIYRVEKGRHDFKPNNGAWITGKNKIEGAFSFTESMYFHIEDPDYPHGSDVYDWNKIAGLTWFLSSNSNWSGMLAWRPNQGKRNSFEIGAYVNRRGGSFDFKTIRIVDVGQTVFFQLIWVSDTVVFKTRIEDETDFQFLQMPLKNPPWWFPYFREIGPWFGGNRPAHKDMTFELEIR